MAQYQYTGSEYTRIELVKGEGKVKVVEGEIVESELPERNFLTNKFVKVEGTILDEAKAKAEAEEQERLETEKLEAEAKAKAEAEEQENTSKKSK